MSILDFFRKNKKPDYHTWSIDHRLDRMVHDNNFRQHCIRLLQDRPTIDHDIEILERIASIDISSYKVNYDLIHNDTLSTRELLISNILSFYNHIDTLSPEGECLFAKAKDVLKYLNTDPTQEKTDRSYCSYRQEPDGTETKRVFCNLEGRIGDTVTGIHETGHGLSKTFEGSGMKDEKMREIATVPIDQISKEYLKTLYPDLAENFNEDLFNSQIVNVIKARESLIDAYIMKVMAGEMTIDELKAKYDTICGPNKNIMLSRLDNIENIKFSAMYEMRYLLPQAIALEMRERYMENPELAASQVKWLLENDATATMDEAILHLGILPEQQEGQDPTTPQPSIQDQVMDMYVSKYHTRMQSFHPTQQENQNPVCQ